MAPAAGRAAGLVERDPEKLSGLQTDRIAAPLESLKWSVSIRIANSSGRKIGFVTSRRTVR
jgi:hypothetical protein